MLCDEERKLREAVNLFENVFLSEDIHLDIISGSGEPDFVIDVLSRLNSLILKTDEAIKSRPSLFKGDEGDKKFLEININESHVCEINKAIRKSIRGLKKHKDELTKCNMHDLSYHDLNKDDCCLVVSVKSLCLILQILEQYHNLDSLMVMYFQGYNKIKFNHEEFFYLKRLINDGINKCIVNAYKYYVGVSS